MSIETGFDYNISTAEVGHDTAPESAVKVPLTHEVNFGSHEHDSSCHCPECAATQQQADLLAESLLSESRRSSEIPREANSAPSSPSGETTPATIQTAEPVAPIVESAPDAGHQFGESTISTPDSGRDETAAPIIAAPRAEITQPALQPAKSKPPVQHEAPLATNPQRAPEIPTPRVIEPMMPIETPEMAKDNVNIQVSEQISSSEIRATPVESATASHAKETPAAVEHTLPIDRDSDSSYAVDIPDRVGDILDAIVAPAAPEVPQEILADMLHPVVGIDDQPIFVLTEVIENLEDSDTDDSFDLRFPPATTPLPSELSIQPAALESQQLSIDTHVDDSTETAMDFAPGAPISASYEPQLEQLIYAMPSTTPISIALLHETSAVVEPIDHFRASLEQRLTHLLPVEVEQALYQIATCINEAKSTSPEAMTALDFATFRSEVLEPMTHLLDISIEQLVLLLGIHPDAFELDPNTYELLRYFTLLCQTSIRSVTSVSQK